MNINDMKDIAAIPGVIIALIVYITNSLHHRRQLFIDNALRFVEADRRSVESEFLAENIHEMEKGTFKRNLDDEDRLIQIFINAGCFR